VIVDPIKDIEKLQALFKSIKSPRNRMMFIIAYFACIRISDVLKIKLGDLKKDVLLIQEKKTDKIKQIDISGNFKRFIEDLLPKWEKEVNQRWNIQLKDDDYIFISQRSRRYPMTREQAYRIISKEAKRSGIYNKVGTHTMRKSSAWQAYVKDGIAGAQRICNHASPVETIRYLGVTKEFEQKVYSGIDKVFTYFED
jgi:site-specific recombinase XerD